MDMNIVYIGGALILAVMLFRRFFGGRASPKAVKAKIEAGATVIDVRSPGEFASGAYPNAKNIPLDRLTLRVKALGAKDGPIVVYCASGSRSAQAAAILRGAGFTDVLDAGGLSSMSR